MFATKEIDKVQIATALDWDLTFPSCCGLLVALYMGTLW